MYAVEMNRDQLVDVLAGRKIDRRMRRVDLADLVQWKIPKKSAVAVWNNKPPSLPGGPDLFVLEDTDVQEFFAYTATYVSTYFPFSAFFKVVAKSEITLLLNSSPKIDKKASALKGFIGMTISEAFAQAESRVGSVEKLSIPACLSTISYVIAQAFSVNYNPLSSILLEKRWDITRSLLGSRDRNLAVASKLISEICGIVWHFHYSSKSEFSDEYSIAVPEKHVNLILSALSEYHEGNKLGRNLLQAMGEDYPEIEHAILNMEGAKEDRVRIFQDVARYLTESSKGNKRLEEFAAAYLLVRIGRGSLKYLPLAVSVAKELPGTPIWFGYLSGVLPDSDVLSANGCLGRRLLRKTKLREPHDFLSELDHDISFHEFYTLHHDEIREIGFRTEHPTQLSMEIMPGVIGRFQAFRETKEVSQAKDVSPSRADISELQRLLYRAADLTRRMSEKKQGELFEDRNDPNVKGRQGPSKRMRSS